MLGRKKRFHQNVSFAVDVIFAGILIELVYLFLRHYSVSFEGFLRKVSGYPFNIQGVEHLEDSGLLFPVVLLCLFLSLHLNRFYVLELFVSRLRILWLSFKSLLIGLALTTLFFYIFSVEAINRSFLVGFFTAFGGYQVLKEYCYRWLLIQRRYRKRPLRAVIVCSAADVAKRMQVLRHHDMASVQVSGICLIDGEESDIPEAFQKLFVGHVQSLAYILTKHAPEIVFLTDQRQAEFSAQNVIYIAEEQGIEVWYFAAFLEPSLARPEIDEFGGSPVIVYSTVPHYKGRFLMKRMLDLGVAALLLIVLSPLLVIIAVLIKMQSDGPVFYYQKRTGWRGRHFGLYKFRTMRKEADMLRESLAEQNEMEGPAFKMSEDPRVTRIGKWLRRYSLDELPQLWNVLKGEMSLVGPRPLPVYETEQFSEFRERRRLSVLPGMTGLWQVSGRSDVSSFSEWIRLDLQYIDEWSFGLDLRILCKTIPVVMFGQGAK